MKNEPSLLIFGMWNPEKIPHQMLTKLSNLHVKCSPCTRKN